MKEIEIKAKLTNKENVTEKLKSLGCIFESPITQEDMVYVKNIGSLKEFRSNDVFLRIRIKNKSKILFTLKKRMTDELFKFFESIGIQKEDRVVTGYDILMIQKNES